jgi:hypothetical protein
VCPLFELLFEIFVFFKLPICTKKRFPFVNLNFLLQSFIYLFGHRTLSIYVEKSLVRSFFGFDFVKDLL